MNRLRLKAYEHPDGGQLDLIAFGSTALGLSLAGESLDAYEFATDTPRLTLIGAEQAELIFRAQLGQRVVEKRLRFQGNRYRLDMALTVSGLQPDEKLGVDWSGSLADTENSPDENAAYMAVVTRSGGEVETWNVADLGPDADPPPGGQISWFGIRNKYFLVALIPPEGSYSMALSGAMRDVAEWYDVEILAKAPIPGSGTAFISVRSPTIGSGSRIGTCRATTVNWKWRSSWSMASPCSGPSLNPSPI